MTELDTLVVKLTTDAANLQKGLADADSKLKDFKDKFKDVGDKVSDIGGKLTAGVTLPIVGVGTAAVAMATKFNGAMANVASLGVPIERVKELKTTVQDMSIAVGKSTDDLSDGLYQVVSAFGDTADSVEILDTNARAAAAGLATTTDSINLTSSVTKGYGDVSAASVKKVADLAFVTANLGQTTFPELAASMGTVVPMAVALGATQEELFAQMTALTGVTGNTSEVTTQLRATYQAILAPTADMAEAIATVATQLDREGKLASGPLVDAWKQAKTRLDELQGAYHSTKTQLEQVEEAMVGANAQSRAIKDAITAEKLATDEQVRSLREQLLAIDTNTEAGQAQAAAIRDQISQLKLASEARQDELRAQLLTGNSSDALKEQYKLLTQQLKDQEQAVDDQVDTVNQQAAALGQSIVKTVGLNDAIGLLSGQARGNTDTLSAMFGSVEALNAVLALSGPQANAYTTALEAMKNASGAADKAFEAQTQGINKLGFTWEQLKQKMEVTMQRIGDALLPVLSRLLDAIQPIIDKIIEWANWFANADAQTQNTILIIIGLVAALGPLMMILGPIISLIGALGPLIGLLANPVGLAIAAFVALAVALGLLAAAFYFNWGGIRTATEQALSSMIGSIASWSTAAVGMISDAMGGISQIISQVWSGIAGFFGQALQGIIGLFASVDWGGIGQNIVTGIWNGIVSIWNQVTQGLTDALTGLLQAGMNALGIHSPSKKTAEMIGKPMAQGINEGFQAALADVSGRMSLALSGSVSAVGAGAGAGSGPMSVVINQTFAGAVDAATVRGASSAGVLEAMRALGVR